MTIEYLETHRGIGLLDEVTTVRVSAKAQPKAHGRKWTPAMPAAMSRRLKQVIAAKRKAAQTRSKTTKKAAAASRKPQAKPAPKATA